MDLTPKFAKMDFSEDSGCGTASSMEFSSLYESTPSISHHSSQSFITSSRKRKTPFPKNSLPIKVIPENGVIGTTPQTPWIPKSHRTDFLSSTLNESRLENLIQDHLTPNFYLERDSIPEQTSREEPFPVTPPRLSESKVSANRTSSSQKLGSPERNEILYPNLKHFGSPYQPPTPQNLKRFTPAKKRLFGVARKEKTDPVTFFMNEKHRYVNIIEKIFLYLDDKDLYNIRFVSTKWKNALATSRTVTKRLDNFMEYWNLNKENMVRRRTLAVMSTPSTPKRSPPSPTNRMFNNFMEVRECLKDGQTLKKCPKCDYPSIVDQNISQCQRDACGYIFCVLCNSFSSKGPENFIDECQMSKLVIEKPEKTRIQALLSDSPLKSSPESELPSFFVRDSSLNASMLNNSSGYITDSELSYSKTLNMSMKEKSNPLHDFNRDLVGTRKSSTRRSSLAPVVPINVPKEEIMEPSSPPKIKCVRIGSKASKKNLKRLFSS